VRTITWSRIPRRDARGQGLVEFALVAPILLILLAVGADLGRVFFIGTQVTNAAREGALYSSQHGNDPCTNPGCESALDIQIRSILDKERAGYSILGCPSWSSPPNSSQVTISFTNSSGTTVPPPKNTTTQVVITAKCDIGPLFGFPPLPSVYHAQSNVQELIVGPAN
jgi:hypothetical protein